MSVTSIITTFIHLLSTRRLLVDMVIVDTRARLATKRGAAALIDIALLGATTLAMLLMDGRG